jgi:hypothetical protein
MGYGSGKCETHSCDSFSYFAAAFQDLHVFQNGEEIVHPHDHDQFLPYCINHEFVNHPKAFWQMGAETQITPCAAVHVATEKDAHTWSAKYQFCGYDERFENAI